MFLFYLELHVSILKVEFLLIGGDLFLGPDYFGVFIICGSKMYPKMLPMIRPRVINMGNLL